MAANFTRVLLIVCALVACGQTRTLELHGFSIGQVTKSVINLYVEPEGRLRSSEDDVNEVIAKGSDDSNSEGDAEVIDAGANIQTRALKLVLNTQTENAMSGKEELATKKAIVNALSSFKYTPCVQQAHGTQGNVKCSLLVSLIRDLTLLGLTFSSEAANQLPSDSDTDLDQINED